MKIDFCDTPTKDLGWRRVAWAQEELLLFFVYSSIRRWVGPRTAHLLSAWDLTNPECVTRVGTLNLQACTRRNGPRRKAGLLIAMIKWTRTSRMSTKISLSKVVQLLADARADLEARDGLG